MVAGERRLQRTVRPPYRGDDRVLTQRLEERFCFVIDRLSHARTLASSMKRWVPDEIRTYRPRDSSVGYFRVTASKCRWPRSGKCANLPAPRNATPSSPLTDDRYVPSQKKKVQANRGQEEGTEEHGQQGQWLES